MKTPINYIISVKNTLKCAIENINQNCIQATVVVDENNKLCGIVTDGDIRRALLNEISLDDSVERVMTQDPISVYDSVPEIQILAIMRKNSIHHIPVINQSGEVINVHTVDDHLYFTEFTNHVVIMAGGKGERLRPLTNDCPKPMLKVDGKPILEHVLQNCISSGFSKFLISVNYLKEQIKDYFSSGKKWGVEISYIEEKSAMGTCGSLSLVSDLINQDFLVINGDIFTDLDFGKLLKFHQKQNFPITLCTRNFEMDVPFAVVNSKNSMILNIIEKPVYNFNINAGVYVLSPKTLGEIPNSYFEMTDLVQQFLNEKKGIGVFPLHENWRDIGTHEALHSIFKN